ncbi:MAG: hypothetical protein FWD31_09685, partial [Planctomycetaceae bacterium]|nr:hypothetical protein [Planctomycetaceae bacterium]
WFADIENRINDVLQKVAAGQIDTLPDIGIGDGVMARKTRPANVVASPLSPDTPWAISGASFRLGLTVEAGNADRSLLPIELEVSIPELVRGKLARAFLLSADGQNAAILPTQLDPIAGKSTRLLTLIVPELKKEETAMIHVYFGLESAPAEWSAIATWDGDDGMKVIENEFAQIHLGSEGGHAYKWIVKGYDGLDMTDPGNTSYHGFSDHGHADRSKRFELVCMNNGPAMVRYGCYFDGELVKTLTVYAGMPILDVITSYPTGYYWNFDDPDLFAADGKTPGTYLFSNGKTGPTPPKGASNDLQIKESGVFWAIKTNEQGLMHGMTTPEATSRFVIGPGGNMGGIGIESGDARSHFVTLAGVLAKNTPSGIMDQIRETYNLKNQPVVTQYAQEQP